jgi:hypothetical protein
MFLFNKEIFVAETVRKLGLRVAYDTRLKIQHNEHKSTKLIRSREVAAYMRDSAIYCAKVFFSKEP